MDGYKAFPNVESLLLAKGLQKALGWLVDL